MPRRPTSHDVARLAGVSRTTVSLVLNNVPDVHISPETRQRVCQAAEQLNYYPDATARRLARGKAGAIALVWHPGPADGYRDAFLPGFLQGISRATRHYGYYLIFRPIEPDEDNGRYVELARGGHADGLILSGPRSNDPELVSLQRDGYPVVLHGQLPGSGIPSVDIDNIGGGQTAVAHLLERGHRRIAMITNAPEQYASCQQRLQGYRTALAQAGIPFDDQLVQYGNFDEKSGMEKIQPLLDLSPRPTAVFVASDHVAMGVLRAVRDRGLRVPQDLAIVGFDDITAAQFVQPALTTVQVPAAGLGWSAAELLIRIIAQDTPGEYQVVLETELIVRESCGTGH
jgi:DNA-binding LacI/PurR family transcriptional regulator